MQCYSELVPPTAVSHSVSLPFLHAKANNLIVAKTSLLQIFELKSISTEVNSNGTTNGEDQGQDLADDDVELELHRMEDTTKLVLICEYQLAGTVTALKRVKTLNTKSGGEALLIAFRDAKLSLVEWDPESYKLSTTSVHYYEGEGLQTSPYAPDLGTCRNFLTVDPSSRCAALKFGQRQLAILPFRQVVDDFGEDYDPEFDEPIDKPKTDGQRQDGDGTANETPYKASFALSLTALDPTLTHPVHLAFLHGFRDPTFGILYSSQSASAALLPERRDILSYTVFNLDLDQRASTSILSVTGLPNDLFEIVALPPPVGGALLLGNNELVHIDQDGKVNALAVNEFARVTSKFAMVDASSLGLRLEHSVVQQLGESSDILLVLNTGDLAIISFELEGRSVSGIKVHKVAPERGSTILPAAVSSASILPRSCIFFGSEECDSIIVGWSSTQRPAALTRKRSHAEMVAEDEDMEVEDADLDEDEDDIYGTEDSAKQQRRGSAQATVNPADYTFRIHDRLPNFAPTGSMTLGAPPTRKKMTVGSGPVADLEMVYPCGRSAAGGLAVLKREIDPVVLATPSIPKTKAVWGVRPVYDLTATADFHEYVVAVQTSKDGEDRSVLYKVSAEGLEACDKDDFEPDAGATLDMGTLAGGKRILQVLKDNVKVYDENFGLEQIIPAADETTGIELEIIGASFCDPYVSLLRDDSSITVWQSTSDELVELDRADGILAAKWLSASVYKPQGSEVPLLFALTAEGALRIFQLPNLTLPVCSFEGLGFLPPSLSSEFVPRRTTGKEALTEIIVADIGDEITKSTYLIIRTKNDDLVIYSPYKHSNTSQSQTFISSLRWRKISQPNLARYADEPDIEKETLRRESMLRRLENVGGHSTVFQTGTSPSFVLRQASSLPRVIPLRETGVKSLSRFHTANCDHGYIYVNAAGDVQVAQLASTCRFGDTSWVTRKVDLQAEVQAVAYYAAKQLYCVATTEKVMFKLPEDEYHHEWAKEETTFLPEIDQAVLRLYWPNDWSVIDAYQLDLAEVVLNMKVIDLEVSEHTRARKPLLCIGTAIIHGEDLPTKGNIYVFEINTVVPEPDRPETGSKFKLLVKEEVRGAVTALTEIGDEGFMLHAQGQKCMIRGMKEDNTLLPVAFMDMQTYVTTAKCLKGTSMALMGDAIKGLWFTGYTSEPYRIILFGKSRQRIEVVDADFLPFEKNLYLVVADGDENLQVLEYDNEDPRSLSGQRLVNKAAFHTGQFPVSLHLVPSAFSTEAQNPSSNDDATNGEDTGDEKPSPGRLHHVMLLTQSGAIAIINPVDEQTYRRLGALHTYLVNQLEHVCGLNPRGYRAVEGTTRGVIDGTLLRRWTELPSSRQQEACAKMGVEEWVVRSDLEVIGGAGLSYL